VVECGSVLPEVALWVRNDTSILLGGDNLGRRGRGKKNLGS